MQVRSHRNPSVMKHSFSQVPSAEIPRSKFDRSHGHKTTIEAGIIYPVYVDEVLPGDTGSVDMTSFLRLATPIFPIMDNMYLDVHFFFVPFRLLWDNFVKQQGEQVNPGDSTDFLEPQIVAPGGGHLGESIYDYFGIPTLAAGLTHSALPLRAYYTIWNQWYRDQNLQNSLTVSKTDGPDLSTAYVLQRRGKRHDYFAGSLPFAQKGTAVSVPLGTAAIVKTGAEGFTGAQSAMVYNTVAGTKPGSSNLLGTTITSGNAFISTTAGVASTGVYPTNLYADLSTATAATINSLRQAFAIQKMFERDARGGTRYQEQNLAHFQVRGGDARLQRAEYLGGGSTPINISPIPQTSAAAAQPSPLGNLAAYGTGLGMGHGFHMSFTEHGLVLGLVSVRADLTYQQGLERMWSRRTRVDRFLPALGHLGEQAVLRKEIYATGSPANDDVVFGYQERGADYRYKPSRISGLFRSNAAGTLDSWHLSQNFGAAPVLGPTFIEENPPVDRCIAVPTEPHFLCDFYLKSVWARPMPLYGVPGFIDRF